ncbi:hypothetical protein BDK92_2700 [Micromonospora pisi]|uniref:Uncharacterized protein n=1 Tax=Micromonospora pisi TaxID=589240 RepID=A0A495JHL8_9ACTN|nr:hypothetical protein BDK92_2700 [Micromonospora pisi]
MLSGGRPVAQSLRAFMSRSAEPRSWPELAAAVTFEPSVKDLSTARLDSLFTGAEHTSLIESFRRVMGSILDHAGGYRPPVPSPPALSLAGSPDDSDPRPAFGGAMPR